MTTNPELPDRDEEITGPHTGPTTGTDAGPDAGPDAATGGPAATQDSPTTTYDPPREEHTVPLTWESDRSQEPPAPRQLAVGYLVTGLVFLGIAGLWLAQETGAVEVDDLDLLVPLLLVVVGAAGLVAGLARAVRRRR
jgi:hypothetical protein